MAEFLGADAIPGSLIGAASVGGKIALYTYIVSGGGVGLSRDINTSLITGSIITASASSIALAGSTACKDLNVQAFFGNETGLYLGNSTNQHLLLNPGDSIALSIDNVNKVFIRRSGTTNVTAIYLGGL